MAGTLDTKVAVVTGAATGLGLGMVERFAREGYARVFGLDISPAPDRASDGVRHLQVDVSDSTAVAVCIENILDESGGIDVLVCNAAVMQARADVLDISDDTLRRVMATNFDGVFYCCQSVGRHMKAKRSGRIITVSSQVAEVPWPGMGVYAASKAAVIALTRSLALELAPFGIFANCIMPGTMDTKQMRQSFEGLGLALGVDPGELIAAKRGSMPLGRMGTEQDAANLAVWLASSEASFSVGGVFDLTGGELWSRSISGEAPKSHD